MFTPFKQKRGQALKDSEQTPTIKIEKAQVLPFRQAGSILPPLGDLTSTNGTLQKFPGISNHIIGSQKAVKTSAKHKRTAEDSEDEEESRKRPKSHAHTIGDYGDIIWTDSDISIKDDTNSDNDSDTSDLSNNWKPNRKASVETDSNSDTDSDSDTDTENDNSGSDSEASGFSDNRKLKRKAIIESDSDSEEVHKYKRIKSDPQVGWPKAETRTKKAIVSKTNFESDETQAKRQWEVADLVTDSDEAHKHTRTQTKRKNDSKYRKGPRKHDKSRHEKMKKRYADSQAKRHTEFKKGPNLRSPEIQERILKMDGAISGAGSDSASIKEGRAETQAKRKYEQQLEKWRKNASGIKDALFNSAQNTRLYLDQLDKDAEEIEANLEHLDEVID